MKIAINKCYEGFGLSKEALEMLAKKKNIPRDKVYIYELNRTDSDLISVIEELGTEKASSGLAELKIVEIPDGTEYSIQEYDGVEWIAEKHQTWE